MRFKVIDDAKLKSLMEAKYAIAKEALPIQEKVKALQEEIDNYEKDFQKILLKLKRYDDKIMPLGEKYKTDDIGEFEEYSRFYIEDDEKRELRLEIVDKVEIYQNALREQKEKAKLAKEKEKTK